MLLLIYGQSLKSIGSLGFLWRPPGIRFAKPKRPEPSSFVRQLGPCLCGGGAVADTQGLLKRMGNWDDMFRFLMVKYLNIYNALFIIYGVIFRVFYCIVLLTIVPVWNQGLVTRMS